MTVGARLDHPLGIYPMVEEGEASGRVAAVYSLVLESMPFVPSLFKSLASCPRYLVLAWDQASHATDQATFGVAVRELVALSVPASDPPPDQTLRDALAAFAEPLARMQLLAAGLLHALGGAVSGRPASERLPPSPSRLEPSRPVPSPWDAGSTRIYGDIRRALDTPIVNSVWRSLAERQLLAPAWEVLAPQAGTTREQADAVQARSIALAAELPWPVTAGIEALDTAGIADAAPAMASILDAYVKTLPRVLVLVASSRG